MTKAVPEKKNTSRNIRWNVERRTLYLHMKFEH